MKPEPAYQGWAKWLGAAALGALSMYFSDPDRGRRRRALAQNKMHHLTTKTSDGIDVAMRDLGNRLAGAQAGIKRWFARAGKTPDDAVLAARIRAKFGRVVSHPHAISVVTQRGHVALSGPILANEKQQLLDTVRAVPGVAGVDDKLEIHHRPDGISSLQGAGKRMPEHLELMQENWTPALRGIAVAGGAVLGGYGLTRRTPAGAVLAVAGLALFARGISNMTLKRLLGLGSIKLEKTIAINVPIETVFDIWTQYKNFPYFMSHVLEVRELDQQRSHWVLKGRAGPRLEWDAILTEYTPPALLAWKTEPGAAVEHAGSVYFEPTDSGTRVTVRMSYRAPAGASGHGLAVLLGTNPKQELDDDLMRMKAFTESGNLPHDAARPVTTAPGQAPGQLLH